MIPQVIDIYQQSRFHLGDTQVPGGQLFNDNYLRPHFSAAYMALYRWLSRNGAKGLRKDYYFNLKANTSQATPLDLGIANNGKPQEIYERTIGSTFLGSIAAINASSAGTLPSIQITINGHNFVNGSVIVTFGFSTADITDDINSEFTVTIVDANNILLNGCSAKEVTGGTAVGTTGYVSAGSEPFGDIPLQQAYDIGALPLNSSLGQLTVWMWQNGYFRFVPATIDRQIKINVALSSAPPNAGSVGIDDSLDALALFTAASAGASKRPAAMCQALWMRAIGNTSGDTMKIMGGQFYELAQSAILAINNSRVQQPRFRSKRNTGPNNGFGYGRW